MAWLRDLKQRLVALWRSILVALGGRPARPSRPALPRTSEHLLSETGGGPVGGPAPVGAPGAAAETSTGAANVSQLPPAVELSEADAALLAEVRGMRGAPTLVLEGSEEAARAGSSRGPENRRPPTPRPRTAPVPIEGPPLTDAVAGLSVRHYFARVVAAAPEGVTVDFAEWPALSVERFFLAVGSPQAFARREPPTSGTEALVLDNAFEGFEWD